MRKTTRLMVAALALTTVAGCKPLDDTMVAIFGRSMRDSRSFDPYENPRYPAEGSVSFSSGNFPAGMGDVNVGQPEGVDVPPFTQMDLNPLGTGSAIVASIVNPVDPNDADEMDRGEEMYLRFCAVCHGADGVGVNAYIAGKHPTVAAYNISGATVAGYTDQYIYAVMRVGRGIMPAYGSRITHYDRWRIVNYVRVLQQDAGSLVQPDAQPDAQPGEED